LLIAGTTGVAWHGNPLGSLFDANGYKGGEIRGGEQFVVQQVTHSKPSTAETDVTKSEPN
jgi:hypothetical protein